MDFSWKKFTFTMMKICSIDVAFPSLDFSYSIYGNRSNNTTSWTDQQVSNEMMEMLHRCYIFSSLISCCCFLCCMTDQQQIGLYSIMLYSRKIGRFQKHKRSYRIKMDIFKDVQKLKLTQLCFLLFCLELLKLVFCRKVDFSNDENM